MLMCKFAIKNTSILLLVFEKRNLEQLEKHNPGAVNVPVVDHPDNLLVVVAYEDTAHMPKVEQLANAERFDDLLTYLARHVKCANKNNPLARLIRP